MMKKSQPKPPVKKYTAQDSVKFQGVVKRQTSDMDKMVQSFPKVKKSVEERMNRRQDSMFNSPYFKAKAKPAAAPKKAAKKK